MTAPAEATAADTSAFPRLIAITDFERTAPADSIRRFARLAAAARPGSVMLQLRSPGLSARALLEHGRELARVCRLHEQRFQVNDRLDLALLLEAEAVHLGEASVGTGDARSLLGPRFVTRACHDPGRVSALDADGVLLSPVMAARKGLPALGLAGLERARRDLSEAGSPMRLYALGGVDRASAARCLEAGADGVAAVGAALADGVEALVAGLGIARASAG